MSGSAEAVATALRSYQRLILTSHARPDGDAIGSSFALALALDALGKQVRVVFHDPAPSTYADFPAMARMEQVAAVSEAADAAVLLECSDVTRPGVAGLEQYALINVDHHLGNEMYGAVNWFDASAAACGEMVADIIDQLDVSWTTDIAAHLYLALSTDTGGFRYGPISARTFEICRRIAALGVDTALLARRIFDSYSIGRVRLTGALLDAMELHHDQTLAVLAFDDDLLKRCGATPEDTEGLVNIPLSAREVVAVVMMKRQPDGTFRISLRSKGDVDVQSVAAQWQGGGHRNAAGCTIVGEPASVRAALVDAVGRAIRQ